MVSVCLLKFLCVAHTKLLAAKSTLNEQCKTLNFVHLSLIVMGGGGGGGQRSRSSGKKQKVKCF